MSKKMLINASHPEENRVAIVVDGILSELDIEIAGQEQTKGNIYKAVVVRVESGLQAAFVDYGAEKLGFLQIGEIHPNLYPAKEEVKGRPRITDLLRRGQEILVQIVKEERGNKGAALTTFLSLPGRYMVLMPDSTTKGVSRKIQDDSERKKLKKTMAELDLPERMGYIVRTAGIGKEKEELKRDFDYLVRLFEGIIARQDQIKAPDQVYQESNLVIRSIRDYFSSEMDEVLIDDDKVYKDAKDFFTLVMPELANLVKQHRERRPIFSRYQIEEQIELLAKNQIPMPSGGSIVIDQTEALVAIDVNSGKMASESGIEATAVKTNLEAAAEVGRQLRLRDLGGLVVIDFIDMRDRKHVREVEQELRKALKDDKAKVTVGRISQFGLMEMSRQRLKPTLSVGSYLQCPHCQGKGRIKSAENQAVGLLRQIHAAASKGHIGHIEASVPLDVANDLLNSKRQALADLERRLNLKVSIIGRTDLLPGQLDIELHKREKTTENGRDILPVSHSNQIEIALAAAKQDVAETQDQAESLPPEEHEGTPEQTGDEEQGERKSRRRRRRRRRKGDHPTEEAQLQANQEQPGSNSDTQLQPAATEESSAATAEHAAKVAEANATADDQQIAAESGAALPTVETAQTDEKPKRRRRPRKKSSEETAAIPAAAEAAEHVETSAPAQADTENSPAVERPKRRGRRPKQQITDDAPVTASHNEAATTGADASREVVAVTDAAQAEEQPKRRTRRTSKPAALETATEETTEAATEVKPKRGRPRKTAPKVNTAITDEAENPPAEPPKRRTRRPTKKAEEATGETANTEQPPAEQPKRRTRRTTKKAEDPEAAAVNDEQPEAEKPKRRTRKPAAKSAEPAIESAAAEEATPEKPKRRRRTTKKTPAAEPETSAE